MKILMPGKAAAGRWLIALLTAGMPLLCLASTGAGDARCRFGILRMDRNVDYDMEVETRRIPRQFKDTGFRWGISFENRTGQDVKWYEIVRLPAPMKQVSGDLHFSDPGAIRSEDQHSNAPYMVDSFWFDEGDPLGAHRIELYVNGRKTCEFDFDVVEPPSVSGG